MPKKNVKFTKAEDQENCARLLRLKEMGIPIGSVRNPAPEADRLSLERSEHGEAWIYELPSGMVAVVAPVKLTVRMSGVLITDVAMITPDIDCQLDLSDPTESNYYQELIELLPYNQTEVLNGWLTSDVPLRRRQVQGAIIAEGWTSVAPNAPKWHEMTPVAVELFLWDERRNEYHVDFTARVSRSLQLKYERRQQERHAVLRSRSTKREGLFAREGGQLGDQKSVSPEEAVNPRDVSGERDGGIPKPN